MNREHAFRFLTVLTCEDLASRDLVPTEYAKLRAQTAQAFIEAFPESHPGESAYQRLSRPPDPRRLAAFKADADTKKGAGKANETTEQGHFRWVAHHLERAQQPLEHKAPEPVRIIPCPSSQQALRCVAALERLAQHDMLTAEDRGRLKAEMSEVIEAWCEELSIWTEDGPCPDCGTGYLQELDASAHLRSCIGHAAFTRLEAVREASRILGLRLDASVNDLLPPPQPRPSYGNKWDANDALAFLLESPAARRKPKHEDPLALLSRIGREWAHFIDRTSDPCPWCGEVLALPQMLGHLRSCLEHPAEKAAQRVRATGQVPVGLERLVFERISTRRELALLSIASETFESQMGWTGEAAYSDKYSETPWRAAIERARKFLGLAERNLPIARSTASPLHAAMTRLLSAVSQPVGDTLADIATVRVAAEQFDQWVKQLGFTTTCPACARQGVLRADLADHLEACPLHPAVRDSRASAAIRQLREGLEVPQLRLGQFDTDDHRKRYSDLYRKDREAALAALFEFEASELSEQQVADLKKFVQHYEELESVSSKPPCPWCGTGERSAKHLLACEDHPALSLEKPRDQLEELAARLQYEADQCAVRLARLHEACVSFWNGMSDGEHGKSISNPRIDAMWGEARKEATALLATIEQGPPGSE